MNNMSPQMPEKPSPFGQAQPSIIEHRRQQVLEATANHIADQFGPAMTIEFGGAFTTYETIQRKLEGLVDPLMLELCESTYKDIYGLEE